MDLHFRAFIPGSWDQNHPDCFLCQQQTDREMEFVYYIVEQRFSWWIPMHEKCYRNAVRRIRQKSWATFASVFLVLSGITGWIFWRGNLLRVPGWLILITLVAAGVTAFSLHMSLSVKLEYKLRDNIDQKNRFED